MTSLVELNKSINLLQEKIEGLTLNFELTVNKNVTATELEIASAKIINDISSELDIFSAKIIAEISKKLDECPCNREIIEAISNTSVKTKQSSFSYKGLTRHVPPYSEETSTPLSALVTFNQK